MAIVALVTAWLGGPGFALLWTLAAILVLREWLTLVGLAGPARLRTRPQGPPQSVPRDDLGRNAPASISRSKAPVSPSTAYSYTAAE